MNDQISRQKLIEEFEEMLCTMIPCEDGTHAVSLEAVIEFIKMFQSQPPADQWIPCSERLPEEQGYYLVTYDFGGGERVIGKSFYSELYNRFTTGVKSAITAWMPLPEPYKGVE